MSITFDEIIEQYGDRIVEETKKSYAELVERGMVLKKEPSGKLRLLCELLTCGVSFHLHPGF